MSRSLVAEFAFFALLATMCGCATVIKGSGRAVAFTSEPEGAQIYVQGKYVGTTPVVANVDHGRDKIVEARKDGYAPKTAVLTTSFSGHSLWLLEFSLVVDALTGAMFTVDKDSLHLELKHLGGVAPVGRPVIAKPAPVAPAALAAQGGVSKRLAVLEFLGGKLDDDVLSMLADSVRGGALQGMQGLGVAVMTRENMLVLLKDMGKQECTEGDCEVETARNIGADYVISGRVVRLEQIYVITLKLHETKEGTLLGSETVEAASQVELMHSLRERGRMLTADAFGRQM